MNNIKDVLIAFKSISEKGIIAFFNHERKTVFVTYYTDILYVLKDINLDDYDDIQILEKDIPSIYGKNFFLKYYYNLFYKQGYSLINVNRYLPAYKAEVRYRPKSNNFVIVLTTVGNVGKKLDILGITDDPVKAYDMCCIFNKENNRMPFCLWNANTNALAHSIKKEVFPNNYDIRVIFGLERQLSA
jgi:hypothetical protein